MLFLSINVIRRKIPGLDYSPYGVKRRNLPSVPRFDTIMVNAKNQLFQKYTPEKTDFCVMSRKSSRDRQGRFGGNGCGRIATL